MRSATRKKTGKDPAYLEWIRSLACCACAAWHAKGSLLAQRSITEAAHAGTRGLSQKADDRTAIPLCALHHRTGVISLHQLGRKFWAHPRYRSAGADRLTQPDL